MCVKKCKLISIVLILVCMMACSEDKIDLEYNEAKLNDNILIIESKAKGSSKNNTKIVDDKLEDMKDTQDKQMFYFDNTIPKEFGDIKIFDNIDDYPNVDGSTALIPLMVKIMSKSCGISEEDSKELTVCNKTDGAWKNLARGRADLLIVGSMPEVVKVDIENNMNSGKYGDDRYEVFKYKEYLCYPIRREGLVFIVNKNNPITSLTQQQLIDIYTGKITNWKEIGGKDMEIKAFQRDETSGSQTYFRKLLMKDIEPEKAEVEKYIGDMGGLIDVMASYDKTGNAIGYSVYYYAKNMYTNDNLKIIAVDGIEPSNDTISSGSYPLLTESLIAIRKDEKEDSNTHKLYDYIRSEKGRDAIIEAGYVPVS